MGNQPTGWSPPPYTTAVATTDTGTAPGGATLLAAGVLDTRAASKVLAVYHFNSRMLSISALVWTPITFQPAVPPNPAYFNVQVRSVAADFPMADGNPTPANLLRVNNITCYVPNMVNLPTIIPDCVAWVGGPWYGCVVDFNEQANGAVNVLPGPARWALTVYGVAG